MLYLFEIILKRGQKIYNNGRHTKMRFTAYVHPRLPITVAIAFTGSNQTQACKDTERIHLPIYFF